MKLATLSVLLGVALLSNVHAAEQGSAAVPSQKSLDRQADTAAAKKPKAVRNKKAGKKKAGPEKQDGAMMSPSEAAEQSVQLRGVRG